MTRRSARKFREEDVIGLVPAAKDDKAAVSFAEATNELQSSALPPNTRQLLVRAISESLTKAGAAALPAGLSVDEAAAVHLYSSRAYWEALPLLISNKDPLAPPVSDATVRFVALVASALTKLPRQEHPDTWFCAVDRSICDFTSSLDPSKIHYVCSSPLAACNAANLDPSSAIVIEISGLIEVNPSCLSIEPGFTVFLSHALQVSEVAPLSTGGVGLKASEVGVHIAPDPDPIVSNSYFGDKFFYLSLFLFIVVAAVLVLHSLYLATASGPMIESFVGIVPPDSDEPISFPQHLGQLRLKRPVITNFLYFNAFFESNWTSLDQMEVELQHLDTLTLTVKPHYDPTTEVLSYAYAKTLGANDYDVVWALECSTDSAQYESLLELWAMVRPLPSNPPPSTLPELRDVVFRHFIDLRSSLDWLLVFIGVRSHEHLSSTVIRVPQDPVSSIRRAKSIAVVRNRQSSNFKLPKFTSTIDLSYFALNDLRMLYDEVHTKDFLRSLLFVHTSRTKIPRLIQTLNFYKHIAPALDQTSNTGVSDDVLDVLLFLKARLGILEETHSLDLAIFHKMMILYHAFAGALVTQEDFKVFAKEHFSEHTSAAINSTVDVLTATGIFEAPLSSDAQYINMTAPLDAAYQIMLDREEREAMQQDCLRVVVLTFPMLGSHDDDMRRIKLLSALLRPAEAFLGAYKRSLRSPKSASDPDFNSIVHQWRFIPALHTRFGDVNMFMGHCAVANSHFDTARKVADRIFLNLEKPIDAVHNTLGKMRALTCLGKFTAAQKLHDSTFESDTSTLSLDEEENVHRLLCVGQNHLSEGDLAAALSSFRKAESIVPSSAHAITPLLIKEGIARTLMAYGNYTAASKLFDASLKARQKMTIGDSHISLGESYLRIAQVFFHRGKWGPASRRAQKALAVLTATFDHLHWLIVEGQLLVTRLRIQRRERPYLLDFTPHHLDTLQPDSSCSYIMFKFFWQVSGELAMMRGDYAHVVRVKDVVSHVMSKYIQVQDVQRGFLSAHIEMAVLSARSGFLDEAMRNLTKVYAPIVQKLGTNDALLRAEYYRALGVCHFLNYSFVESSAMYNMSLAEFATLDNEPNNPFIQGALRSMAVNAVLQGQYAEALSLLDSLAALIDRDDHLMQLRLLLDRTVALHFADRALEANATLSATLDLAFNKTLYDQLLVEGLPTRELYSVFAGRVEQYDKAVGIHIDMEKFYPKVSRTEDLADIHSLSVRHVEMYLDLLVDTIGMVDVHDYDEKITEARLNNSLRATPPKIDVIVGFYEQLGNSSLERNGQLARAVKYFTKGAELLKGNGSMCAALAQYGKAANVFVNHLESHKKELAAALKEFSGVLRTVSLDEEPECDKPELATIVRLVKGWA